MSVRITTNQPPKSLVTPSLETADYLSQMLLHRLLYKQNAMNVIGHQLESQQAHLQVFHNFFVESVGN